MLITIQKRNILAKTKESDLNKKKNGIGSYSVKNQNLNWHRNKNHFNLIA